MQGAGAILGFDVLKMKGRSLKALGVKVSYA